VSEPETERRRLDPVRLVTPSAIVVLYAAFLLWLAHRYHEDQARAEKKWDGLRAAIYLDFVDQVKKDPLDPGVYRAMAEHELRSAQEAKPT
jgi:hypothetical protein